MQYKREMNQKWRSDPRENLYTVTMPNVSAALAREPSNQVLSDLKQNPSSLGAMTAYIDDTIKRSIDFWDRFPSDSARLHMLRKVSILLLSSLSNM